jgi:hypothetical protein
MAEDQNLQLAQDGWLLFPELIDNAFIVRLREELERAYLVQRDMQIRNGVGDGTDGTVHHLPCMKGSFLEVLDRGYCEGPLRHFFGGPYVLNTFGGVLNLPGNLAYVGKVHRDLRTHSGNLKLMAQLLVMLDDFNEENGATYFLSGSHRLAERPADEEFFSAAVRVIAKAGSVVLFDSNMWHAAGINRTGAPRRALTLVFSKPFMKPQFDYPRAIGYGNADALSDTLRQVLGYNARVPATFDEWYQPPEKRMYRPGQG